MVKSSKGYKHANLSQSLTFDLMRDVGLEARAPMPLSPN